MDYGETINIVPPGHYIWSCKDFEKRCMKGISPKKLWTNTNKNTKKNELIPIE